MKARIISLFLLFALFVSVLSLCLTSEGVSAYYPYVLYTPVSSCNESTIYTAKWASQTFRTGNCSISVANVSLDLYRTGLPGNTTVQIVPTDSGGDPTYSSGNVLVSATMNGSSITDSTSGEWVAFTFPVSCVLNKNTNYSIVIYDASANPANCINILCNDSALYTGGAFSTSVDSGATWTKNVSRSALFIVGGNPATVSIDDTKVFKNVFEPDDRLFVVVYNVSYSLNPHEAPGSLFDVVLLGFSARQINYFNNSVISIYLSAQNATTWEAPETIWINGNSTYFTNGIERATFSVTDSCYVNSSSLQLGRSSLWSYILSVAATLGVSNNISYTFSSIYYGNILNTDGCVLFESAVPGLGTIFPLVGFYLSKVSTEGAYFDYVPAPTNMSLQSTYLGQLGNTTDAAFTSLSTYLVAPAGFLKALFCLFLYAIIASIVFLVSGDSIAALILAFPVICYGVIVGLIPIAVVFVFAFFMSAAMAYFVWLH